MHWCSSLRLLVWTGIPNSKRWRPTQASSQRPLRHHRIRTLFRRGWLHEMRTRHFRAEKPGSDLCWHHSGLILLIFLTKNDLFKRLSVYCT